MRASFVASGSDLPSIGNGIVSRGRGAVNADRFLREVSSSEEEAASAALVDTPATGCPMTLDKTEPAGAECNGPLGVLR